MGWRALTLQGPFLLNLDFIEFGLFPTKRVIKMAGYWSSSFFIVFMDRDGVEVHKQTNENLGQSPAILNEQAWLIKLDLLCGKSALFSSGTQRVFPSRQDSAILLG